MRLGSWWRGLICRGWMLNKKFGLMGIKEAKIDKINEIAKVELGSGYHKRKFDPVPMLKKVFRDKNEKIFVYIKKRKVIVYVGLRFEKKIGVITLLAVLKSYQKKGIGKKLVKKAISLFKKNKVRKIILDVRNNNVGALVLYLKSGFIAKQIKEKKEATKLRMEKKLK